MTRRLSIPCTALVCGALLLTPAVAHAQSFLPDSGAAPVKLKLEDADRNPASGTEAPPIPRRRSSAIGKGVAFGLLAGLGVGVALCANSGCSGDEGDGTMLVLLMTAGIGAGAGAGVGAIVDAVRPSIANIPVYKSPDGRKSIGVTSSARKRSLGLVSTIKWK